MTPLGLDDALENLLFLVDRIRFDNRHNRLDHFADCLMELRLSGVLRHDLFHKRRNFTIGTHAAHLTSKKRGGLSNGNTKYYSLS